MSDIKLFSTTGNTVRQLQGSSVALEKSLQNLIETNLETFLGVRFLATEYSTGKTHGGRIDTLGIDENGCPCILEYKRSSNENVMNQGLFYLDWLLDHKGEFELLVLKQIGQDAADSIEWSSPRLLCIAGDFTKYDGHAVQQINRNIELLRYLRFGDDLFLLELVNAVQASVSGDGNESPSSNSGTHKHSQKSFEELLRDADDSLVDLFEELRALCMSFGDDVQMSNLKYHIAFKRIKNFACVDVRTRTNRLLLYVKVDPDAVSIEEGFTRDMRAIGHYGTGDLEITISSAADLAKATPLLEQSYAQS